MSQLFGIIFSLGALFSWAFGDFNIQRSTRAFGVWKSLFYIGIFGFAILLPFVWSDLSSVFSNKNELLLLIITSFVVVWAGQFNFLGLKNGKFSVIMPLTGLELPITIIVSVIFVGDRISWLEGCVMGMVFLGLMLLVVKGQGVRISKENLEKGVLYGLLGALGLALVNVLIGLSSRATSPLVAIWFTHTFAALYCAVVLLWKKEFKSFKQDFVKNTKSLLYGSILDNFAWLCFAYATTFISIAIATTISECFIAVGALLGMTINHEKLKKRQVAGMIIAISGVIILSALAG